MYICQQRFKQQAITPLTISTAASKQGKEKQYVLYAIHLKSARI